MKSTETSLIVPRLKNRYFNGVCQGCREVVQVFLRIFFFLPLSVLDVEVTRVIKLRGYLVLECMSTLNKSSFQTRHGDVMRCVIVSVSSLTAVDDTWKRR